MLAQIDDPHRFLDILHEANRANASFCPIEPRGLVAFDTDIGPNPPPPPSVDMAMLTARHEALKTAALDTDGLAVMDSNDIDKGLKRVTEDLSSYYLIGYSSTNAKPDGKFRTIRVRVKRPGVEVRARRGYKAPTEEEVAMRAKATAAPPPSAEASALTRALSSLESSRPGSVFRLTVSSGWWMPKGMPLKGQPVGSEPALWVLGEVDPKARGGEDWAQGGEAVFGLGGGARRPIAGLRQLASGRRAKTVLMLPIINKCMSARARNIEKAKATKVVVKVVSGANGTNGAAKRKVS